MKEVTGKHNICNCLCHTKDSGVMHFIPCCSLSGKAYFNEDGTLDEVEFHNLINPPRARKRKK